MNHNDFDEILREKGWYYDNGWSHDSIHWDCYQVKSHDATNEYFVILANEGVGRLLKITNNPVMKAEIWAGPLSNTVEIEALMSFIKGQKHE